LDMVKLIDLAFNVMKNAHAPYSGFKVGAVLICNDGRVFTGCNVENASYGLSICAERVAVFKAISEGYKDFEFLVLVSDSNEPCFPCGACRQVLWEFNPDLKIILSNKRRETEEFGLRGLLPRAFFSQKKDSAFFGS